MSCSPGMGGYNAPPNIILTTGYLANGTPITAVSIESYLATYIAQLTRNPLQFLQAGGGRVATDADPVIAAGPGGAAGALSDWLGQMAANYPLSVGQSNLSSLASKYAGILAQTLQGIPACNYNNILGVFLTGSVYDNWGLDLSPSNIPTNIAQLCPDGYDHYPYPDSPCTPIPSAGVQVTPGTSQQSVPPNTYFPPQTNPAPYTGGSQVTVTGTQAGGQGGTSPAATQGGGAAQTPFVSANLIPASTLTDAMTRLYGYPTGTPAQWCGIMSQLLGGFVCPALPLSSGAPIDASTFLAALRQVESGQTVAPVLTQGGFLTQPSGAPVPAPVVTAAVNPPGSITISPVVLGIAVALIAVILFSRRG